MTTKAWEKGLLILSLGKSVFGLKLQVILINHKTVLHWIMQKQDRI